jgi:hypothetical protein
VPKCSAGGCVACVAGADCPISGQVCTTAHTCICRPPSAGNLLLQNPGFDASTGIDNWNPTTGTTFSSKDADGCPGSGSAEVSFTVPFFGTFRQCVAATANTPYFFGYKYEQDTSQAALCMLTFYSDTTCSTVIPGNTFLGGLDTPVSLWLLNSTSVTSPIGASSAEVFCQNQGGGNAFIDQIYLNSTSNSY